MPENPEQQLFFIRYALSVANKGRLTAPPNPWVGCVIVKDGGIVGEGYHVKPGEPHAEMIALQQAGPMAKNSTVYITLEPCSHHGRTPPCVEALIEAQVSRVVIPLLDPDPNVSGMGAKALEKAGIEVIVGIGEYEAEAALASYLHHRRTGLPYCLLKSAVSIDGRTAAADGTSQWITGEAARHNAHLLRAQSQAILIGAETALKDDPRLTVRGIDGAKQPLIVLLDSKKRVPSTAKIFENETLVWENGSLLDLLKVLGKRGVIQLLVEGGARVHTSFIEQKLAQRFVVYIGSCLLGKSGRPFLDLEISSITQAPYWHLADVTRFDHDVRLDYELV